MINFFTEAGDLQTALNNLQQNLPVIVYIVIGLLVIHFINWLLGHRLRILGIFPRRLFGIPGIFFSPFIHGDFNHLFFNLLPFCMLSALFMVSGLPTYLCASAIIIVISGTLTWIFGRRAFHIGASGLIMGYLSYLLIDAYHQPSFIAIGVAVVCIYYFGSLLFSVIPGEDRVSWEGHLFGLIAGLAANYLTPTVLTYLYAHFRLG